MRLRRGSLRHLAYLSLHRGAFLLVPFLRVFELGPSALELGLYGDPVGFEVSLVRLEGPVYVVDLRRLAGDGFEGDVALSGDLRADLRDGTSDVFDKGVDDSVDVLHSGDESCAAGGDARRAVHLAAVLGARHLLLRLRLMRGLGRSLRRRGSWIHFLNFTPRALKCA